MQLKKDSVDINIKLNEANHVCNCTREFLIYIKALLVDVQNIVGVNEVWSDKTIQNGIEVLVRGADILNTLTIIQLEDQTSSMWVRSIELNCILNMMSGVNLSKVHSVSLHYIVDSLHYTADIGTTTKIGVENYNLMVRFNGN